MFTLPNLNFAYGALEPHIDAKTMEIHHTKHHQAYITNLNTALEKYPDLQNKTVEELLKNIETIPEDIRTLVKNNGGGHANHSFFWTLLTPNLSTPLENTKVKIDDAWGSFENFKEAFTKASLGRFGSGWCWLVRKSDGDLEVYSTANQDSPLTENKKPLLGLDVWEHAYYLNYQNRRADYVQAFWNIVNWEQVEKNFAA